MKIYTFDKAKSELSIKPAHHPAEVRRCSYPGELARVILVDATNSERGLVHFRAIIHDSLKGASKITLTDFGVNYVMALWREGERRKQCDIEGVAI